MAAWLKAQGYHVVRTADIAGGPPMLEGAAPAILPDLLVAGSGASQWVEVKCKGRCTWCRKHKRDEHGIPRRNWESYLEVQRQTGIPGALAILERSTGIMLLAPLDQLNPVREHSWMQGEEMYFFPRNVFDWYDRPPGWDSFAQVHAMAPRAPAGIKAPPVATHKQLGLDL